MTRPYFHDTAERLINPGIRRENGIIQLVCEILYMNFQLASAQRSLRLTQGQERSTDTTGRGLCLNDDCVRRSRDDLRYVSDQYMNFRMAK